MKPTMEIEGESVYRRWIELYDAGEPAQAMALTSPDFAMLTPDGRRLERDAALEMTRQMKAYIDGQKLSRKTDVVSLHVVPVTQDQAVVHAQVELTLSNPDGPVARLRFAEVIHVGPSGISFDSFSRLSESQTLF